MTDHAETRTHDERVWRANWLLATVWLVFMAFPLISLWWGPDIGIGRKVAATLVVAVFAVVYALGFRRLARGEALGAPVTSSRRDEVARFAILIVLTGVAFAIGGWGMLGMVPFIVAFAVFHFRWRETLVVAMVAHVVVIGIPLLAGRYDDLWPITIGVATATAATMLGRFAEERAAERMVWRAELLVRDDRQRVARDVHDVLGHSLTAVVLKAELTQRLLDSLEPEGDEDRKTVERCRAELDQLLSLSRRSLSEIRSTVGGLRAPNLPDELAVARSILADRGVGCTVIGDTAAVVPADQPTLAWVIREATTNIVRHAAATDCAITLGGDRSVLLRVDDDGVGPGELRVGNGIAGLRERVAAIGATLTVDARTPQGTRVEVRRG